eukprot:m.153771 g.153771  ORF g.153771 m.153771 type:complete len:836 (+) comp20768_c1_seq5:6-2513(+)
MSAPEQAEPYRLLLVGGGHTNAQVLLHLTHDEALELAKQAGRTSIELVLVSDSDVAYYSGMIPACVAGLYDEAQCRINLPGLCHKSGWRFVRGTVCGISSQQKLVRYTDADGALHSLSFTFAALDVGSCVRPPFDVSGLPHCVSTRPIALLNGKVEAFIRDLQDRQRRQQEQDQQQQQQTQVATKTPRVTIDPEEEECTVNMLHLPSYAEFASTYLHYDTDSVPFLELIDATGPVPDFPLVPRCYEKGFFSMRSMDHIPGIANREEPAFERYGPESGLKEVALSKIGPDLSISAMGHVLAVAMKSHPKSTVLYNVATVFWRVMGNAREAIECVRHALHFSNVAHYDVPLVNLANVFQKMGRLEDAVTVSRLALQLTRSQRIVAHFTLANALASLGKLDDAAAEYQATLDIQPSYNIAAHSLKIIRCVQLYRRRKDEEMASLRQRLKQIQELLSQQERHETSHLWEQLRQAERRLDDLLMQQASIEAAQIPAVPGMQTVATSATVATATGTATITTTVSGTAAAAAGAVSPAPTTLKASKATQKAVENLSPLTCNGATATGDVTVVVEYPRAPAIPQLIAAIRDMFSDESVQPIKLPHTDCEQVSDFTTYTSTWISPLVRSVSRHEAYMTLPPSDFAERVPICNAPVNNTHPEQVLEHLDGVKRRAELVGVAEKSLASVLNDMYSSLGRGNENIGRFIAYGLSLNTTSWVVLNLAGLYWRVQGNAERAVECLQRAFYFSPDESKDIALNSLANVLHLGKYTVDAITVMQMAIQVAPKGVINHFSMANILASLGEHALSEAAFFFEAALRLQRDFGIAQDRLSSIRCVQATLEELNH